MVKIDQNLLHSLIGTTDAPQTRIQRFKTNYLSGDCDSDEEETLSNKMFLDDLNSLRTLIHNSMQECLGGQLKCE